MIPSKWIACIIFTLYFENVKFPAYLRLFPNPKFQALDMDFGL